MTKTRKQPAGPESSDAGTRASTDQVVALREAVDTLTDMVRLLRHVVYELRRDFQWVVRNPDRIRCRQAHVMHITSMAKNPCDAEWGAKLNAVPPTELERLRAAATGPVGQPSDTPSQQPELF